METFSALLAICAGNLPVPGEFPAQRPVTRSFDVFLDLRLKKRLSNQSWGWWFETPSCSLQWCHNEIKSNIPWMFSARCIDRYISVTCWQFPLNYRPLGLDAQRNVNRKWFTVAIFRESCVVHFIWNMVYHFYSAWGFIHNGNHNADIGRLLIWYNNRIIMVNGNKYHNFW